MSESATQGGHKKYNTLDGATWSNTSNGCKMIVFRESCSRTLLQEMHVGYFNTATNNNDFGENFTEKVGNQKVLYFPISAN